MDLSEWIAFRNRRVASYSQYSCVDDDFWQSGLCFADGRAKRRVYDAFRMPLFVRSLGGNAVEVFGGLRTPGGSAQVESQAPGASYRSLGSASVNSAGYFRRIFRVSGASATSSGSRSAALAGQEARGPLVDSASNQGESSDVTLAPPRLTRLCSSRWPSPLRRSLTGCLVDPGDTRAARGMELAIQDDYLFVQGNSRWQGDRPFEYARAIGVTRIRVNLLWAYTMTPEQYNARNKPSSIDYQFLAVDQHDRPGGRERHPGPPVAHRPGAALGQRAPRRAPTRPGTSRTPASSASGSRSWPSTSPAAWTATASGTSPTGRRGSAR